MQEHKIAIPLKDIEQIRRKFLHEFTNNDITGVGVFKTYSEPEKVFQFFINELKNLNCGEK